MEKIQLVLKNFSRLLNEKNKITIAEAEHIRRSIKFIKNDSEKTSQFYKDSKIIYDGLSTLIRKLGEHEEDIKKELDKINLLDSFSGSQHLEYIIMLDCMQSRSYSFAEKLEYLHDAYKNLVDNYQYPYIPTPNINKRIKTSNLTLYFNKILNIKLETMKHFFGLRKNNQMQIFSTWSFYENEHLKEIDSTNNEYISFSFWFFEKQIFYPIAYHEIAHALYKHEKHKKFKLTEKDEAIIAQKLFFDKRNKGFSKSFLYSIYEDVIADISAYSMAGESYIHALFYTGFFEKFHTIFYEDLIEKSITSKLRIDDNDRKCSERHKNLTLMAWKTTPQFESFFTRIKVLLAIHKKFNKKEENFSIALKGIEKMLYLIYPNGNDNLYMNNFEDMLNSREKHRNEYQYSKNFTLLLSHLFVEKILKNKELLKAILKTQKKQKQDFHKNKQFSEIIIKYLKKKEVKEKFIARYKNYISLYDFSWDYRYMEVKNNNKYIPLGRFLRLYNISQLELVNNLDNLDNAIYELTLFKFKNENKIKNILNKKYFLDNDSRLSYAFGPYDSVVLNKTTTTSNDARLREMDNEIYFTERHALFELCSNNGDINKKKLFDLIISISMKNEFIAGDKAEDNAKKDFHYLKKIVTKVKDKYTKAQFFISMGHENFLIYFYSLDFKNISHIIDSFEKEVHIIRDIHSTVLLNSNILHDNVEDVADKNFNNIVLLCKLKNPNIKTIDEIFLKVLKIYVDSNILLSRLYGVYDLKINVIYTDIEQLMQAIVSIDNLVEDIQIEYQPKYKIEKNT